MGAEAALDKHHFVISLGVRRGFGNVACSLNRHGRIGIGYRRRQWRTIGERLHAKHLTQSLILHFQLDIFHFQRTKLIDGFLSRNIFY